MFAAKKLLLLVFVLMNFLSGPAHSEEGPMKVKITINNDKVVTATMEDSQAAKDFVALLPLTLTLRDFKSTATGFLSTLFKATC